MASAIVTGDKPAFISVYGAKEWWVNDCHVDPPPPE